jgi:pimeloyl-ACP methyl ester carboxylesterase
MKQQTLLACLRSIAMLATFPIANAQSTTCNETCQQLVQVGIDFEHSAHAHTPRDDFYSIPSKFNTSMKPGMLLYVEPHTDLANYTVPSGLSMSRIMYTSADINGTTVPVSAYVLWPYQPFQYSSSQGKSKFPLVAWAHGTSGQFVDCAPSNYRSLQYHFMTSYTLAMEGFAVVATDYAGLGVTTGLNGEQTHAWLSGPVGANDVAYAIDAVRKAFPDQLDADGPFVTMGHSQGGNVAWAFAERQASSPQAGYRGTISISPPTKVIDWLDSAFQKIATTPPASVPLWAYVVLSLQPKIIASITTVFPAYNFSGMTALSYDRWNNVLKPLQGCLPTDALAFADVPIPELAKPGWTNDSIVQQWQDQVHVGGRKFKGPLLVIGGEDDVTPPDLIEQSVDDSCKVSGDQSLEMVTYQAMQHFPVIQASRVKWLGWIKDRVTGGSVHGSCGKKSFVEGFNTNYTIQSTAPNWLVDWVPMATEGWKQSL